MMKTYARMDGDTAVEIITIGPVEVPAYIDDTGETVAACTVNPPASERFHPDVFATMIECPPATAQGARLVDGKFKAPAEFPEMTIEVVRAERGARLAACDWTQLSDVPSGTRDTWAKYRQALRDVPAQSGFPTKVKWPKAPE